MKYIALLYGELDAGPARGTPEFTEMLGEFQSATAAMLTSASWSTAVPCSRRRLLPLSGSATVRCS